VLENANMWCNVLIQWHIASRWLGIHSWAQHPSNHCEYSTHWEKLLHFEYFIEMINDMLFLYRADNILMICVLDGFNIFKYVEIWKWYLYDSTYGYENMIWVIFWWVLMYAGVEI
jgi:hypothetical protein